MKFSYLFISVLGLALLAACGSEGPGTPEPGTNSPPTIADFAADKPSGTAPLDVVFSWTVSDPEDDSLSCTLDFGDGSEVATVETCTSSSTQAHTYSAPGDYTAKLTVKDASKEASDTLEIKVSDAATPEPESCDLGDNATPETACALSLGEALSAKVDADGDTDFYTFTTTATGVTTALVASVPADVSLDVTLFNAQLEELSRDRFVTSGEAVSFPVLAPASTYYVSVKGTKASADPYEISATFDGSDANELNNSDETATELTLGQTLQGDINGVVYTPGNDILDTDFFTFETTETGVAEVILSSVPTGSRLKLRVLDAQKNEIRSDASVTSGDVGQFFILSEPGRFYIEVANAFTSGFSTTTEPYDIRVNLSPDETELNNADETATRIDVGDSVQGSIYGFDIANNRDVDFYSFEASGAGTVVLSSVPAGTQMQFVVTNTASPGSPICNDVFVPSGDSSSCAFTGAGTYVVKLSSNKSSAERYTLSVSPN